MKQLKFKTIILIAISSIMTFFMLIYFISASHEYRESIQKEKFSITNFYIQNLIADLDNSFQNFATLTNLAFTTPELTNHIKSYYKSTESEQSTSNKIFLEAATELLTLQDKLCSVCLFDTEYHLIFQLHYRTSNYYSPLYSELNYNQNLTKSILNAADTVPYGKTNYGFLKITTTDYSNPNYIYAARKLRTFSPYEDAGYLILIAPTQQIVSSFTTENNISNIFLLDAENKIVYEQAEQWIGHDFNSFFPDCSEIFTTKQNNYLQINQNNKLMLVSGMESSYSGWKIVIFQDADSVYATTNKISFILITLFIFILLLTIIFITIFLTKITKPLAILSTYLQTMDLNNPGKPFHAKTYSKELFILTNAYNAMSQKIDEMLEKEYKSVIQEKEYQLSLLQMQIQPHFLYNTLDTIRMSAIINQDQKTAAMILELSDFFRRSISSNYIVLLEDEFAQMNSYLSLLKIRYTNLKTDIYLDSKLRYIEIPSFILQPLVENAFMHGLKPHGYTGCITVCAQSISNESFTILIQDDGNGASENTINTLNQQLNHLTFRKVDTYTVSNIGLQNISWRLFNFFGNRTHIQVGNANNGGFFVKIFIREPD